jgi:hypothetical protein
MIVCDQHDLFQSSPGSANRCVSIAFSPPRLPNSGCYFSRLISQLPKNAFVRPADFVLDFTDSFPVPNRSGIPYFTFLKNYYRLFVNVI